VSAPAVLLSHPLRSGERSLEEGLSLTALLELLTEPPETESSRPRWSPAPRPGPSGGAGWRRRAQSWVRSAAGWGAGPEGAWRAW
jgi:hypothetical protein